MSSEYETVGGNRQGVVNWPSDPEKCNDQGVMSHALHSMRVI